MKRNILFIAMLFGVLSLGACKEDHNEPSDKDTVPPKAIDAESISVRSIPGGAVIKYTVPDEADLLAVEGHYRISSGKEFKVRASSLVDSLVVEGYLDIKEYPIQLYVVDRSENYSEPVWTKFIPDEAPLHTIFNSLEMKPDFGGVTVAWQNDTKAPVAIFLLREDEDGEWEEVDTYYTEAVTGLFSVRGMEAVETNFALMIRDKWQNYSEYHAQTLTPIFEEELDYEKFSVMDARYSSAANIPGSVSTLSDLWTRSLTESERHNLTGLGQTKVPWDASFSIGQAATFSRFVVWQYGWPYNSYAVFYSGGNARTYEFYGSNNPTESGTLDDSWTLFLTADITKPSGDPYNAGTSGMTDEDYDIARNRGHEFMIPAGTPAYKYIRIKCTRTFDGGTAYGQSYRLQIFGDYDLD